MERSPEIDKLTLALSKAQGAFAPAVKDTRNPHFDSKYADLAAVVEVARQALSVNGLCVVQPPGTSGLTDKGTPAMFLETILMHESGQWIGSVMPLLYNGTTMQSLGSAITFARRYAFCALVGIVADADDDGNAAAGINRDHGYERPEPRQERPASKPGTVGGKLFKWLKEKANQHQFDVDVRVKAWGKSQGFPAMMSDWSEEQARAALTEGKRIITDFKAGAVAEPEPIPAPRAEPEPDNSVRDIPRSGRGLFAWVKEQEQRHEVGLLKYMNSWGKLQEFPDRMVDWDGDMVERAYQECVRKLKSIPSPAEAQAEPEPAKEPEPEPDPAPVEPTSGPRKPTVPGNDPYHSQSPQDGRQLMAWMRKQGQRHNIDLEGQMAAWGEAWGCPRYFVKWSPGQVNQAVAKVHELIRAKRGDLADVPFANPAEFRIWLEKLGPEWDAKAHIFADENGFRASALMWSLDQCVAIYRALSEDLEEVALKAS